MNIDMNEMTSDEANAIEGGENQAAYNAGHTVGVWLASAADAIAAGWQAWSNFIAP